MNETHTQLLENINKIDKHLVRLSKKKDDIKYNISNKKDSYIFYTH